MKFKRYRRLKRNNAKRFRGERRSNVRRDKLRKEYNHKGQHNGTDERRTEEAA